MDWNGEGDATDKNSDDMTVLCMNEILRRHHSFTDRTIRREQHVEAERVRQRRKLLDTITATIQQLVRGIQQREWYVTNKEQLIQTRDFRQLQARCARNSLSVGDDRSVESDLSDLRFTV